MQKTTSPKLDLYTRVTDKILADLAQGVRPWLKPWNADNTVGRISRPLRADGTPYRGINVLLLWGATLEWLPESDLADLQAGRCIARPCAEGREGLSGRLRRHLPQDRDE